MKNSSLTGAKAPAMMCAGSDVNMKQDIYNPQKPQSSTDRTFVRTHRHMPRVVYSIHKSVPCEGGEADDVSVTSQSGRALMMLGQACLDTTSDSAHTPYLVAHVEYGFNKFATHPKPDSLQATFSLAEFAAHHYCWKQKVTLYDITNQMVEGG